MKRSFSVLLRMLSLWFIAFLTLGTNAYAAGGAITLTSTATTAAPGDLVTFDVELDTNSSLFVNSAGVILQWDASVFALDASSSLGTADDNDPQGTSYLNAFGAKQNDDNNRLTISTTGTSDLFEIRFSDNDGSGDPLSGQSGQAYVNNTRLSAVNAGGAVVQNLALFSVTLKVKAGATAGSSAVQAKVIAISDDAGSASNGSDFTVGSVNMNVVVPVLSLTAGDGQSATVGTALATALQVTAQTGSTGNAGVDVTFTAPAGAVFAGSTTNTETVTTDGSGVATASALTVPQNVVGAQSVTVSATGYSDQTFSFTTTADVAAAAQSTLSANGGSEVSTASTATYTVTFFDQYGNATSDLGGQILAASGATLAGATWAAVDNTNGTATATYTPGATGSESALAVTLAGGQIGTNQALTVVEPTIAITAGDSQTATVGTALATALQVTASTGSSLDSGVSVVFTAPTGAVFAATGNNTQTVTTNASGVATASALTLAGAAGAQNVTATATGYAQTLTFNITATAASADATQSSIAVDGDGNITADETETFTVTFRDQFGNATTSLGGQALAASGEALNSATWAVVDNTDGTATATYTPSAEGTESALAVTLGGSQIGSNQSVTVTHGAATQLSLVVSPSAIASDASSGTATLTATVLDAKGNTVEDNGTINGTNATFSITGGSQFATLDASTAAFASGVASVTLTAVTDATGGTVNLAVDGGSLTQGTASLTTTPFFLNQTAVTLIVGEAFDFTVPGNSETTPAWSQTTPATGSLSATSGLASTYTAAAAGSDQVTVSGQIGGSDIQSSADITAYEAVTTSVTSVTGMASGSTLQLLAFGGDGDYVYTSSDTNFATVDAAGLITAVAPGTITVTVDDEVAYDGATAANTAQTANIQVVAPLSVTSATTVYLDTGSVNTATIAVTGGTTEGAYTYTSDDTGIVTVDANGELTAVAAGSATITIADATYSNITTTVAVNVNAPLSATSGSSAVSGTQTLASGGSYTFTPAGGTGSFSVAATGPATATLTENSETGAWTFTAPTTGSFAGEYTITVTDDNSGLTFDITVSVPLVIKVSKINIAANDTTQTVTVRGGATTDTYTFEVLDGNGAATTALFDNDFSAAVADGTAPDSNTTAADNVVSVALDPTETIDVVSAFQVRATSSNTALAAVTSKSGRVIPVVTYSGTVVDELDSPITGATVELLTAVNGVSSVTTLDDGAFSFVLPDTGSVYQFGFSATGYQKRQLSSTTIGVAGSARVSLEAVPTAGSYQVTGSVTLSDAGNPSAVGAKVKVYDGTNFSDEIRIGADGTFAFYLNDVQFADPTTVAYKLYASLNGYESGSATDADNDGIMTLMLTAKAATPVDKTTLGAADLNDGTALDSEQFDPTDFETGLSRGVDFDADDEAGVDFNLQVEVPPLGVNAPTAGDVHLVLDAAANANQSNNYTSGSEYLFEVSLKDAVGGNDISDNDINRIIITLPFDASAIAPGSLEAGTRIIWHADTVAELENGQGTQVSPLDIHFVDYLNGNVTFEVDSLSVFGVGSTAPSTPGGGGSTTTSLASSGGGGCFIATAAFGSYQDPYVKVLRDFRDQQLMTNAPGQWFVQQYYTYSPAFADWLREHELARSTVRMMLWPVIGSAMLLKAPLAVQLALFAGLMAVVALIRRRRRNRQVATVSA